ncbi:hypothetical protein CL622_06780 [archaeon]|nr:hypothetical protein [archaeon]|tara:strand:- start:249 stop:644 length:396 start_codon:yes stop_codon:yes gene_type:complete
MYPLSKMKDFLIIVFCLVLGLSVLTFTMNSLFFFNNFGPSPISTWSECTDNSANIFISANEDLKDVKCVALDHDLFIDPDIVIGDLSQEDEDVCRLKLAQTTDDPLRFEVWYNGQVRREVCDWQRQETFID